MREQDQVARFLDEYNLDGTAIGRIMDLMSEVGEVAKDAAESTDYGLEPDNVEVKGDEIGDVLFSLLAVCESLDIDAGEALETALDKYRDRFTERESIGSGTH